MTIADAGILASVVIIAVVVVDWRRGVTGIGKARLTKERSPDKFWYALVLYINMAIFLFYASGQLMADEAPVEAEAQREMTKA
ncbi:hypothetical protein [Aurantiacibacter aquimixticola]|uniref:Uncharacterized protein n=1 Tax=Aurantiacibacter aquimixticola TaxID=1958945 RepID=A0A419RW11_9SPHN|nr:hypothetical protein [Aurantiacibacter aquimixticola]RJY09969.1 hypothetical protein D6201_11975 [Aurantiacibacter aquimixticola]